MLKDFLYPHFDLFSYVVVEDWGMLVLYVSAVYAIIVGFFLLK